MTQVGGVRCREIVPAGADRALTLVYLHGGGYAVGSAKIFSRLVAFVAAAAGARALVVDYRLAPELPFPAALDDADAVDRALLAGGASAGRIAVAGDSAGGGLSVALALRARERGDPQPVALGLICPWLDLTADAANARPPAPREPLLTPAVLERFTAAYLASHDAADPLVSPARADLAGIAPLVVHSGADDLLAPDAARIARRAREAGVEVRERCFPRLWHDFHALYGFLAGADVAVRELGAALGEHLRRGERCLT
jgi:acetyl esterase/lipase